MPVFFAARATPAPDGAPSAQTGARQVSDKQRAWRVGDRQLISCVSETAEEPERPEEAIVRQSIWRRPQGLWWASDPKSKIKLYIGKSCYTCIGVYRMSTVGAICDGTIAASTLNKRLLRHTLHTGQLLLSRVHRHDDCIEIPRMCDLAVSHTSTWIRLFVKCFWDPQIPASLIQSPREPLF